MRRLIRRAGLGLAITAVACGVALAGAFPDGPKGPAIAVVNQSTLLTDQELVRVMPMLQLYLDQVCQAWHCSGTLYPASTADDKRHWQIILDDYSEIPDAIGYHDSKGSRPGAYVSIGTARDADIPWTIVFTHELGEMLVDAPASVAAQTAGSYYEAPVFTAYEIADPVQGRSYRLGEVWVSDYVYRSWFTPGAKGPFDSMRVLSAPLQLAKNSWKAEFRKGGWTVKSTFTHAAASWDAFGDGMRPPR